MRAFCFLVLALFSASAFAAETITYTYDGRGRVIQVDHSGTVNAGIAASYAYDDADNRTNVTVTGAMSSVQPTNERTQLAGGAPPQPISPER